METTAIIVGLSGLVVFLIWTQRQILSALAKATGLITSQTETIVRYNDELQENSEQRAAAARLHRLSCAVRCIGTACCWTHSERAVFRT